MPLDYPVTQRGWTHRVHPAIQRQEGDGLVCYVGYEPVVICSSCETVVPQPYADAAYQNPLDASGRCEECQP